MSAKQSEGDRSREAAKAIAQTIAKAFKLPTNEIATTFDSVKDELLDGIKDPSESVEVKRRICEAKISVLFKRPDSSDELQETWNEMESLGYSDLEREATMLFYRAQFLLKRTADKELTANAIERLRSLLGQFDPNSKSLSDHYERIHQALQGEFDKKYCKRSINPVVPRG